jgi:hypothetical protein
MAEEVMHGLKCGIVALAWLIKFETLYHEHQWF